MYGLSDDEIAAIREAQFEAFAPAEVALLRMADAMADTPSNVSDELYQLCGAGIYVASASGRT